MGRELAGGRETPPQGNKIKELHWLEECRGPGGVVPEGKEPGKNVTAKIFADISREVACNNLASNGTICELNQKGCIFKRTPHEQLPDHALSHISHTSDASRVTLQKALGRGSIEVSKLTRYLITEGAVEEGGTMQGRVGRPQRRLTVTGGQPQTPYKTR